MYGSEFDEAHEVCQQLVIARGDTAEVFEFVEEPFDEIAFLVEIAIIGVRSAPVGSWRDDGDGTGIEDGVVEMLGVVGAVGNDGVAGKPLDQVGRVQDFAAMARACLQADRIAESIGGGMDLGAEAAL